MGIRYETNISAFNKIPGNPFAYWVTKNVIALMQSAVPLGNIVAPRQGLASGNNDYFYRQWTEVSFPFISFSSTCKEEVWNSHKKYVPVNKGGGFRRWYGNNFEVIKFDEPNYLLLAKSGNHLPSRELYFKEGITWNKISSGTFSCRYSPSGFIFTDAGMKVTCPGRAKEIGSFLSSNIIPKLLRIFSETLNYETGNISKLPFIYNAEKSLITNDLFDRCLIESKEDWDSFEISWDFKKHPLI